MKINVLKLVSAAVLISLMVGCGSKEETVTYETKKEKIKEKILKDDIDANGKLSDINIVSSDVVESDMSLSDENSYLNQVTSSIDGKNIKITSVHFGFDNYLMRDEMISLTADNAVKITSVMDNSQDVKLKLEGNCDEWGSDEYNFALGLKRTKTVKDELVNNGVKASSIIVVSLGEGNPLCNDHTAKCWKKNRRVDHQLYK